MKRLVTGFLLLTQVVAVPPRIQAADGRIVVVLSSNLKPYQEALAGIRKTLGEDVFALVLSEGDPSIAPDARVIIAVGGKAAVHTYPSHARLIYCLAPGLKLPARTRRDAIRIRTLPPLAAVVARFKQLQPSLHRLSILWSSESFGEYLADREKISKSLGVELVEHRITSAELPRALRDMKGRADGFWLPPDPQLVSETNLATIRSFSAANRIPFYAPTAALVEQGGVAAVSSSFEEMGRTAGRTALSILEGATVPATVYPEKIQITVNPDAARAVGLVIPEAMVNAADGVVR